jgi:soluble lytic murein transglycosylase
MESSSFEALRAIKRLTPAYLRMDLSEAPKDFWRYLFPLPYRAYLLRYARVHDLDTHMVAALIRQESEFNPRARSRANALGLTQVMPGTGRQLARRVGIRRFSTGLLYQPEPNLRIGTYYLRTLLDRWGGKWEETLAAYNAGPSRPVSWITWGDFREPSEFVETVPFTETREYIQAVVRNAALYRQIYQDGFGPEPAQVASKSPAKKPAATASVKKTTTAKKATTAKKKTTRTAASSKKAPVSKSTAKKKTSSSGKQTAQGSKLRRSSPL